ncbi:MAG TPA: Stp1/IreP family PP2C-type Ser/Thr phosphatase [Baekduia sp.]|uniref:Stp1/IreP family PP2C-type Ser/Thr phosphatase n=1 Tax=Baekduia sp. TaxID=2600305 RepID=UPI002D79340C|nr:Stp1/IreP family PP2C-type Ser/Thr phosphatase [Baekduia sp.]HET6508828.1 Stp1/IreP family PP2C-type Ser/Thr phosphatase [Baekduia sp.]
MLRVADHAARTDTGRARQANEDSYWVRSPLFVLADGMGGAQAGEVASKTAVDVFAEQGGLPDGPGTYEERLAALVERANVQVHERALSDEQFAGMGTTLTVAYVGEDDLAIAHVGDSRFYVLREGKLSQLTDDHSLVGELVRRGQISAEEAEDHPQRSIITRALGIEDEVVVDHFSWPVRDGDVFLLCSDGLTGMVPDARVAEIVAGAPDLSNAATRLVAAANEAGGRDNITVILFRVEDVTPGDGAVVGGPTLAGATAPSAEDVRDATATGPAAQPSGAPADPRQVVGASAGVQPRTPRPPRAGGPGSGAAPKRRRRWTGLAKGFTALAVVLVLIASGGWIATRSVYFVGTDDDGFVTLYTGLPYSLPGINLYSTEFTSGVPVQELSPQVQRTVTEHKLRSHDDAVDLIRQLEQGELAGQNPS